ncbi:hypothetical protein ACHAWF_004754 [Thalassiosira exigua]
MAMAAMGATGASVGGVPGRKRRGGASLLLQLLASVASTRLADAFSSSSPPPPSPRGPLSPPPPPDAVGGEAEDVVLDQLRRYQNRDLSGAYDLCSPGNRDATGPLSEFERMVNEPPYDLIVGNDRADLLLEVTPEGIVGGGMEDGKREGDALGYSLSGSPILDAAIFLVRIRPHPKARRIYPVWFWWEVSKQRAEDAESERWMVDCVVPDFDDLDFETESLSIEELGEEGDDDEIAILWDFDP